jgi:signal transduction histidine kinase
MKVYNLKYENSTDLVDWLKKIPFYKGGLRLVQIFYSAAGNDELRDICTLVSGHAENCRIVCCRREEAFQDTGSVEIVLIDLEHQPDSSGFAESAAEPAVYSYFPEEGLMRADSAMIGLLNFARAASDELSLEKELSASILDNQESILVLYSETEGTVSINKKFFEMFSFSSKEDFNTKHDSISELFIPQEGYLERGCFNGVDLIMNEKCKMTDKSGLLRVFKVRAKRLDIKKLSFLLISLTDVTELENAVNAAVVAEKAKSDFLANISHEIRTPLNGILGFTEVILRQEENRENIEYLNIIRDNGYALLSMVKDILDLSRIDEGKMEITNISFEIEGAAYSVFTKFVEKAKEKDIKMSLTFAQNVPKYMYSDPVRLRQIFSYLLSNSLKFNHPGGRVDFSVSYLENENRILFEIQDTGIGIAKEKQKDIFSYFVQEDQSITRQHGGIGLGLAISSRLIDMMGGKIGVVSEQGKGSRFFFSLSASADARELRSSSMLAGDPEMLSGRALIFDEDETERRLMEIVISAFGLAWISAESLSEAEEILKTENVDIIVLTETSDDKVKYKTLCDLRDAESSSGRALSPLVFFDADSAQLISKIEQGFEELATAKELENFYASLSEHLMKKKNGYNETGYSGIRCTEFTEQFKEQYASLEEAVSAGDIEKINTVAYSIYGAAGNLRLERIAEKAKEMALCSEAGAECNYSFILEYIALLVKALEVSLEKSKRE